MTKISYKCRNDVRAALQAADIALDLSDSVIDNAVRTLRKTTAEKISNSIAGQAEKVARSLQGFRQLVVTACEEEGFDADQYGNLFWDLFVASTNNTKSAGNFEELCASAEGWADMITLLLLREEVPTFSLQPWWLKRFSVTLFAFLSGIACLYSTSKVPMPGRVMFSLLLTGSILLEVAPCWLRHGHDLGERKVHDPLARPNVGVRESDSDSVSLQSASTLIRTENAELKARLAALEDHLKGESNSASSPPPPPPGAPAMPASEGQREKENQEPTPLLQAMGSLASKTQTGPMFVMGSGPQERVGSSPQAERLGEKGRPKGSFDLGSPVKLRNLTEKCFKGANDLNGSIGVITAIDAQASIFTVTLVSGVLLSRLSTLFLENLCDAEISEEICALAASALGVQLAGDSGKDDGGPQHLPASGEDFFAPLSEGAKQRTMSEAKQVKALLTKWAGRASFLGSWAKAMMPL